MVWDLLGTFALLASGIVANRYLLATKFITPGLLVGLRMTLSGVLVLLYSVPRSSRLRWNYVKQDGKRIAIIACVATLLPSYLKAWALRAMPAAKQTLLGSIDPFVTAVYAYLLWGERISGRQLVGMCVGFSGIALALIARAPHDMVWHDWVLISWPELASFVSVSVSRYGWILVQRIMRTERYAPHEITALSMALAGFCSLVGTFAYAYFHGDAIPWIQTNGYDSWIGISVLLWSIFIGNIVGYTAYGYALKRHSATVVALTGLSMPLFVAGVEWCVGLGAPPPLFFGAAAILALGFAIFFSDRSAA